MGILKEVQVGQFSLSSLAVAVKSCSKFSAYMGLLPHCSYFISLSSKSQLSYIMNCKSKSSPDSRSGQSLVTRKSRLDNIVCKFIIYLSESEVLNVHYLILGRITKYLNILHL